MNPLVSIVMPARNEEQYIASAIESVLEQTYQNWELLIINDGSTDKTEAIANSINDSRVRVIRQDSGGFVATLNVGLQLAQGNLIARLDADDVALPLRLERQVRFLEDYPGVALVGTLGYYELSDGGRFVPLSPATDQQIRRFLLRDNPFIHSSVIFRREILNTVGYYNTKYDADVDYDMWVRIAAQHPVAIIQEPLVVYRIRDRSLSHQRLPSEAVRERIKIQLTAFRLLGPKLLGVFYLLRSLVAWTFHKALEKTV